MMNKFAKLIIVLGLAVFLYPQQALSRVERLNRLPKNDPKSAFFIGEDMKTCGIEGCNEEIKYITKGLCRKHWNKQYKQNNKEHIKKQTQQYRQEHKEQKATTNRLWRKNNKKHCAEKSKQYYQEHKEYLTEYNKQYCKQYYLNNKEKMAKQCKQYYQDTKEKRLKYNKQYYQDNKEKIKHHCIEYNHSLDGRVTNKRHYASRKRFGFIPLNKPFNGCNGHHIDKEHVIYIPRALHVSIGHSLMKNRNMEEINKLAIEFLNNDPNNLKKQIKKEA